MSDDQNLHRFQSWLREYRGILYKVARAFSTTPDDRDELLQELIIRLWTTMSGFRGDSRPSTWIYQVALNRALTWRRDQTRRTRRLVPLALIPEPQIRAEIDVERIDRLYEAIHRLNDVDRSLVLMSLDGCSYSEMAAVMDITETNVGARLSRSRRLLAERLQETGDD